MSEYWRTSPLGVFHRQLLVDKPALEELAFEESVAEARAVWKVLTYEARREFVERSRKMRADGRRKRQEELERRLRQKEQRLAQERSFVVAYYERRAEKRKVEGGEHPLDLTRRQEDSRGAKERSRSPVSVVSPKAVKRPLLPLPAFIPLERLEGGPCFSGDLKRNVK